MNVPASIDAGAGEPGGAVAAGVKNGPRLRFKLWITRRKVVLILEPSKPRVDQLSLVEKLQIGIRLLSDLGVKVRQTATEFDQQLPAYCPVAHRAVPSDLFHHRRQQA